MILKQHMTSKKSGLVVGDGTEYPHTEYTGNTPGNLNDGGESNDVLAK